MFDTEVVLLLIGGSITVLSSVFSFRQSFKRSTIWQNHRSENINVFIVSTFSILGALITFVGGCEANSEKKISEEKSHIADSVADAWRDSAINLTRQIKEITLDSRGTLKNVYDYSQKLNTAQGSVIDLQSELLNINRGDGMKPIVDGSALRLGDSFLVRFVVMNASDYPMEMIRAQVLDMCAGLYVEDGKIKPRPGAMKDLIYKNINYGTLGIEQSDKLYETYVPSAFKDFGYTIWVSWLYGKYRIDVKFVDNGGEFAVGEYSVFDDNNKKVTDLDRFFRGKTKKKNLKATNHLPYY